MTVLVKPVRYLPALTGVRALAAYLVFLHHHNPASTTTITHRLFEQGYIGVSLFFVLSGFLIYHRYADDYAGATGHWSWRRYLQNRFARIFPLYLLLLFLTLVVNALADRFMSWPLIGLNVTLLKGLFDTYKFTGIPQSWSLTVEVCFYLSAPFLFSALQRWGAFFLTLILTGGGLLLCLIQGLWIGVNSSATGAFSYCSFIEFYTFAGRGFEFVVGMWLAKRWHQNQLPSVKYPSFAGLFVIASCVGWQTSLTAITAKPACLFWSELVVYNYSLPIGIGLFFLGLLTQPSPIKQLLSHPCLQTLGRSSYAFYLIHTGVLANGLQKAGVTNYCLLFGLLLVISHGIHLYLEKPLYQWLKSERMKE